MKNKRGFTLVELLAVIVILAIILAIAIPSISNLTTSSRENSFVSAVKMIIKGIDYQVLEAQSSGTSFDPTTDITEADLATLGADPDDFTDLVVTSADPITINLVSSTTGKFNGLSTTGATYTSITVTTP
jgi:type IV pilus assembly protein PilA